jgi:PAS domain-containing protein
MPINLSILIAILFFVAGVSFLFLVLSTVVNDTRTRMRRDYIFAGLMLTVAGFFYGIMTLSEHETLTRAYWVVAFTCVCGFYPRWLVFLTHVVPHDNKYIRKTFAALFYVTVAAALACTLFGGAALVRTERFGNQPSFHHSLPFILMFALILAYTATTLIALLRWRNKSELRGQRRQISVLMLIALVIAPVGFLTDFIIPAFTPYTFAPLATVVILAAALQVYIAKRRYRLFGLTMENMSKPIIALISVPVFVFDHRDQVCLENNAAVAFMGGSITGTRLDDVIGLENGDGTVTVRTPYGDKTCEVHITAERDANGDPVCQIAALRDVTETKALEASLHKANERLMLMLDTSPLCAQIWDKNLGTIDCNEAGVRLYGFKNKKE